MPKHNMGKMHQKIVDDLIAKIQSGDIVVERIDATHSIAGYLEYDLHLIDVTHVTPGPTPAPFLTASGGLLAPLTPGYSKTFSDDKEIKEKRKKIMKQQFGDEPVTGYRDFMLKLVGDTVRLGSRNEAMWPPRKPMRAFCRDNPLANHDAPEESCQCGIYAYDNPKDSNLKSTDVVWGEVAMWGDVLVCEKGYRAEFAYPTSLFLMDHKTKTSRHLAELLEETYGVPVFLVPERRGQSVGDVLAEMFEKGTEFYELKPENIEPPRGH